MSVAIITGSAGLIGSEAVRDFAAAGMQVVGVDNDMRLDLRKAPSGTSLTKRRRTASVKCQRNSAAASLMVTWRLGVYWSVQ